MKKEFVLSLLILISLTSCLKRDEVVVRNDFESAIGWCQQAFVKEGKAHSGKAYCFTNASQPFSFGYSRKLGEISVKPVRRVDIAMWFRVSGAPKEVDYVLSIDSGDHPVFYYPCPLADEHPYPGEWTRIYRSIYLPENLDTSYNVKVYVWNRGDVEVDADDFEMHFIR